MTSTAFWQCHCKSRIEYGSVLKQLSEEAAARLNAGNVLEPHAWPSHGIGHQQLAWIFC